MSVDEGLDDGHRRAAAVNSQFIQLSHGTLSQVSAYNNSKIKFHDNSSHFHNFFQKQQIYNAARCELVYLLFFNSYSIKRMVQVDTNLKRLNGLNELKQLPLEHKGHNIYLKLQN